MRTWKYNYAYKITCLVTGEEYLGIHSTDKEPEKDNYWGSGTLLRARMRQYGRKNFRKEILSFFNTRHQLSLYERMWITEEIVEDPHYLNLAIGGDPYDRSSYEFSDVVKKKLKEVWHLTHHPHSEETRKRMSEAHKGEKNYLYGKKHSEEWKEKVRTRITGRIKMYHPDHLEDVWVRKEDRGRKIEEGYIEGSCKVYIHNEKGEIRKILKRDLERWQEQGWTRGKVRDRSYLGQS